MSFSIEGNVADRSNGQPLAGATVRLAAAQGLLAGVGGAQASNQPYTWSRVINGSDVGAAPNNHRYNCYIKFVQNIIPANVLSANAFYDQVLQWNPHLTSDGNLFLPGKFYVVPTSEGGPQFEMRASADGNGHYRFDGLQQAGVYGLIVEQNGYIASPHGLQIFPPQIVNQNPPPTIEVNLSAPPMPPPPPPSQRIWSTEAGFSGLQVAVQRATQQALLLITNDETKAYDTLPPSLQMLAYGYGKPPGSVNYKDLVCADLPSICYAAALGHNPAWGSQDPTGRGFTNSHCANYYRPYPGTNDNSLQAISDQVATLSLADDWKPGDVIIFWLRGSVIPDHVNMYVGRFQGTDLDGNNHPDGEPWCINTSMNTGDPGDTWGPRVQPFRLANVVRGFGFAAMQHVRLLDLWRLKCKKPLPSGETPYGFPVVGLVRGDLALRQSCTQFSIQPSPNLSLPGRGFLLLFLSNLSLPRRGFLLLFLSNLSLPRRGFLLLFLSNLSLPGRGFLLQFLSNLSLPGRGFLLPSPFFS